MIKAVLRFTIYLFAAALVPARAQADAAAGQHDNPVILAPVIVVTGPSASDTTALRDTPADAHVIIGDPLTRQNHSNLADLLNANLGAVTLSNGSGSPYQNDVTYRGFQATSLLGSPTGLSVYMDGVRMNEPFGAIVNWDLIPLNAISAIEVLPGSNPLFGLNTLGGALVLTTKNGADNGGAAITVQGGSYNRRAVLAEAGGTMANRTIDWFVSGNDDRQAGYRWYTDTVVRQAYGKVRWHGLSANAELGLMWSDTSLNGTQGLPLSMLGTPQMAYTWPDDIANNQVVINLKGDVQAAPWLKISGNVYYRRSNANSVNSNASLADDCGTMRDCSADAPGGTALDLDTVNPYAAGNPRQAVFTPYAGNLPIHDYDANINASLVTSQTRQTVFGGNGLIDFDGTVFGLKNDANFGGSFEAGRITYNQDTALAYLVNYQTVPEPTNLKYGSAAGFQGSPLIGSVAVTSHSASFNLFVRDMVSLTDRLGLTGSLGLTVSHIALDGQNATYLGEDGGSGWIGNDGQRYYNPAYIGASYWGTSAAGSSLMTVTVPGGGVAGPEVVPVSGSHTYARVNPAIGATWNPLRAIGVYANYNEAMRAPTAIELACADPAIPCSLPTGFNGDPALKAVVAHTVELGARGRWGAHLGWDAAVYRTRASNDIQFIYDASGLGYFTNVGATQRKGAEVNLTADFAKLHLTASYGFVSATYRSTFTDADGDTVVPGDRITGIPAQSVKLRAVYTPIRAIAIGANLIAVGNQYAHGDEANLDAAVPGYVLVNFDLNVMPLPRLQLFANIDNLFDRHYATFGVMGANIYNGNDEQFRTPAPGRNVLVGVRYSLGRAR